ncbi:alcohol dehydrogenase catalytic domain-containing protein [Agarivorans aestuarii]|uniref:alcohol dehydrogenase catalytic domain-containing protein n=1 Tax=Agarivorans aestuarii TaxID=1563703 RepID=UPI001C82442E|nr:zinc-binding dehydrogenase [Agarivorans aestuarii]
MHSLPNQSKAWTFTTDISEPQDMDLRWLALNKPQGTDVVVENKAISLNPVDWKIIHPGMVGSDGYKVSGVDGAGVVVAVGPESDINVGARVAYHQSLSRQGSYGEHAVVDGRLVFEIPSDVDFHVATALTCTGLTAWQALEKLPTSCGSYLLVNGAGGLVGRLAAEIAVNKGFNVVAVADSQHHEALKHAGVTQCFDYKQSGWRRDLGAFLSAQPAFAAIDTVNRASAESLFNFVDVNGHIVTIQDRFEKNPFPSFDKAISIHEVALNVFNKHFSPREMRSLRRGFSTLVRDHQLAVNSRLSTISFDEIPEALEKLKAGLASTKFVAIL